MRRAIFVKFIQVLLAALALNSFIFYIVTSSMMLGNTRSQMLYTLEAIDSMLDYEGDWKKQTGDLRDITGESQSRLTIIDLNGEVLFDTEVNNENSLENHLLRDEVLDAVKYGKGESQRRSATLNRNMLYVAMKSNRADMVLRYSVPFSGARESLVMLFPAIWLSFAVALIASALSAQKFADSITKPLREISQEMERMKGKYTELAVERCQYPEINVIIDTTNDMVKRVQDYLEQIEQEKQIRQEFFSNASHELKTPITSVQGYAELLENDIITNEVQKKDFIKRIKKEAIHMNHLINDILMISQLEAKELHIVKSDVDLLLVAREIEEELRPSMAKYQVTIKVPDGHVFIHAGMNQMKELLGNLMSNAVKYNKPGGMVWVNIDTTKEHVMISVRDNGMGIPQEATGRIFERFYRVDKGRSRKQGGTGLGLSIVKHIVSYYHGTIEVKSEINKGTEFIIILPRG